MHKHRKGLPLSSHILASSWRAGVCAAVWATAASLTITPALAQNLAAKPAQSEIENLQQQLQSQRQQVDTQRRAVEAQMKKLQDEQSKLQGQIKHLDAVAERMQKIIGGPSQLVGPVPSTPSSTQTAEAETKTPEEVGTERRTEEQKQPPQITTLADEGGVLSPKGRLTLEPSIEYSRSSSLRVAIEGFTVIPALTIGSIDIAKVDRDTLISSLAFRYGLTNRLEVDAKVPWVYRNDASLSRPIGVGTGTETLSEVSGSGLGDLEVGAHYQINNGKGGWPYLIGNLRFKAATGESPFDVPVDPNTGLQTALPTGSGFYAIQPSITAIMASDPAVFFGNIGYLFNMARDVGGAYGEIDPGDAITASFGMGLSVNDKTSFNVGYSHSMVFETTQNGNNIANSNPLQVGSLDFGFAYRMTPRVGLNLTVGAGLTEDAPDARVNIRVPVAFDMLK